jgi:hypothetical protein
MDGSLDGHLAYNLPGPFFNDGNGSKVFGGIETDM